MFENIDYWSDYRFGTSKMHVSTHSGLGCFPFYGGDLCFVLALLFSTLCPSSFSYLSTKTYFMSSQKNRFNETVLLRGGSGIFGKGFICIKAWGFALLILSHFS